MIETKMLGIESGNRAAPLMVVGQGRKQVPKKRKTCRGHNVTTISLFNFPDFYSIGQLKVSIATRD